MFNVEKLKQIAKPRPEKARQEIECWRQDRQWLQMSQDIALNARSFMKSEGLTQKELAERMDVSPAYVARIMKGNENMTIQTIAKLEHALGMKLVAIPKLYEAKTQVRIIQRPIQTMRGTSFSYNQEIAQSQWMRNDHLTVIVA